MIGLFQFNVVLGILLAYFSNYLIGLMRFGEAEWRWMLGVASIPAALFLLMLFGIPRSPRWLVKEGPNRRGAGDAVVNWRRELRAGIGRHRCFY